tara:strand:+ start:125 stop:361 length:237 start_codon:yes stop_codon:yes gene_type:complete
MERDKTLYEKALSDDFQIDNIVDNLNRCREITNELRLVDVIDPSSRQIGLLCELLYRIQNMPDLEILDFNLFVDREPN